MDSVNRKKLAKLAVVSSALTFSLMTGTSIFNESQASSPVAKYQAVGEDGVNYCYCNKAGSKCGCIL